MLVQTVCFLFGFCDDDGGVVCVRIGVRVDLSEDIAARVAQVRAFGLDSFQLHNWHMELYTDGNAARVRAACAAEGVTISSLWAGWSGRRVWDLYEGPLTLGFLPEETRARRIADMKLAGDFAEKIGVKLIATHAGFIPEQPHEAGYRPMIEALREIAAYFGQRGQTLLFETGQETPVTLLRAFEDIGLANLGVNLDPANLLMYGKANPVDALDLIGRYVRDVHAKDGEYPVDGKHLGKEKKLGDGRVNFPALVAKLRSVGYDGTLTIEREITGSKQTRDIESAIALLRGLI